MSGFSISSSTPLAGLSTTEQKDFQRWMADQATAGSKMAAANKSMDDIFRQSPIADIMLAQMAPELKQELESRSPSKKAIGMLSTVLASTQNELYDALFQDQSPDWLAQWDPSKRASDKLDELHDQYGFFQIK
jgi:hypothetical protein